MKLENSNKVVSSYGGRDLTGYVKNKDIYTSAYKDAPNYITLPYESILNKNIKLDIEEAEKNSIIIDLKDKVLASRELDSSIVGNSENATAFTIPSPYTKFYLWVKVSDGDQLQIYLYGHSGNIIIGEMGFLGSIDGPAEGHLLCSGTTGKEYKLLLFYNDTDKPDYDYRIEFSDEIQSSTDDTLSFD